MQCTGCFVRAIKPHIGLSVEVIYYQKLLNSASDNTKRRRPGLTIYNSAPKHNIQTFQHNLCRPYFSSVSSRRLTIVGEYDTGAARSADRVLPCTLTTAELCSSDTSDVTCVMRPEKLHVDVQRIPIVSCQNTYCHSSQS